MANIVNARIMLIVTPVCHGALRAPSHPCRRAGGCSQSGGGKHLFNRRQVLATLPAGPTRTHSIQKEPSETLSEERTKNEEEESGISSDGKANELIDKKRQQLEKSSEQLSDCSSSNGWPIVDTLLVAPVLQVM
ncbi:hypothetical protein CBL_05856 [Carabus blaptoides fortunei]